MWDGGGIDMTHGPRELAEPGVNGRDEKSMVREARCQEANSRLSGFAEGQAEPSSASVNVWTPHAVFCSRTGPGLWGPGTLDLRTAPQKGAPSPKSVVC